MTAIKREEINSNVAAIGVWAFAVADLEEDLPRIGQDSKTPKLIPN